MRAGHFQSRPCSMTGPLTLPEFLICYQQTYNNVMPKTNILKYYVDALGEDVMIEALAKTRREMASRSPRAERKISPVTNPIMRFMIQTVELRDGKLHQNFRTSVLDENQYVYFNVTGGALRLVSEEVKDNSGYINELKRGMLGIDIGGALSDLNELISGAFYKQLGHRISFANGHGKPDVDILGTQYATDAKLFPGGRIQLQAALNESRTLIPEVFSNQSAGDVIVFIRTPDKKSIHASLKKLLAHIEDNPEERFKDDSIGVLAIPNHYQAGDLTIRFLPQDFRVHFQAVWPMDKAVDLLKQQIIQSIKQSQRVNKRAITWVFVPDDAKKHAIQSSALRFAAGFHQFVESQSQEGLQQVVVYSVVPTREGNKIGASISTDVYGHPVKDILITRDTVHAFLGNLLKTAEIIIP